MKQVFQSNKDVKIVVACPNCNQKLFIPHRSKKLRVTCPTCRYEFDYPDGEVFNLIIPTELKGLIASPIVLIVGSGIFSLFSILPKHSLPDILQLVSLCMIALGIILFVVFGILALVAIKDITRFRKIDKLVIARVGITLYRKDATTDLIIYWQQIKTLEIRGLKHLFGGIVETHREPVAIIIKLVDGSIFTIPLHLILKEKDRSRMVSAINYLYQMKPE